MLRDRMESYFKELSWAEFFLLEGCDVRGWKGDLQEKGSRAFPGLKITGSGDAVVGVRVGVGDGHSRGLSGECWRGNPGSREPQILSFLLIIRNMAASSLKLLASRCSIRIRGQRNQYHPVTAPGPASYTFPSNSRSV